MEKDRTDIVCIYTTYPGIEEARSVGFSAVKEKMAISADYWFVNSIYPWKGVVKETTQCVLMLSTQRALSEKLVRYIESHHPYEVPVITRYDASMTNTHYSVWTEKVLSNKEPYITESEKIKRESVGAYERLK